jgi:hypothetical protein
VGAAAVSSLAMICGTPTLKFSAWCNKYGGIGTDGASLQNERKSWAPMPFLVLVFL